MTAFSPDVDARMDFAILREMCGDKHHGWGGRDPRVSTESIAARVGVAGSTVRARLAQWERIGFLKGIDVMPNPRLLGGCLATVWIRAASSREKARVLDDLALLPGVRLAVDHVGDRISVVLIGDSAADHARTTSLLRRLPGIVDVGAPEPYPCPTPTVTPTRLDWRLLAEIRRTPRARVAELAGRARASTRSYTRRYEALVGGDALLFWLLLDFRRYPGVVARLRLDLDPGTHRHEVLRTLRDAAISGVEPWPRPAESAGPVEVLAVRRNVPEIEEIASALGAIRGVASTRTLYPCATRAYGDWADAALDRTLGDARAAAVAHVAPVAQAA